MRANFPNLFPEAFGKLKSEGTFFMFSVMIVYPA